jgi:hypothetical protein
MIILSIEGTRAGRKIDSNQCSIAECRQAFTELLAAI